MTLFYLASKSPRRAQILRDIGFHDFTVLSDKTVPTAFAGDEVRLAGESTEDYVSRTAREKALRAFNPPSFSELASSENRKTARKKSGF